MDIYNNEIIELWKSLDKHQVKYIMIGGFAVNFHGHVRNTNDIDIWFNDTDDNRGRLGAALEEIGVAPKEIIKRMEFIPGWTTLNLKMGFVLDIMTKVKGLDKMSFEAYYEMALKANVLGIIVPFIHYNHLLESKQAANRKKDQEDIENLKQINPDEDQ